MATTLGEVAALAGVSKQAVHKAGRRGLLDFDEAGHPDLNGAKTKAWLARQRARSAVPRGIVAVDDTLAAVDGAGPNGSASLTGLSATLHGRLYDLALWDANTCEVDDVRADLHSDCDCFLRCARNLPVEAGCHIALLLAVSSIEMVDRITRAMNDYLRRVGDQHQRVEETIAKVQRQWLDYPIRRVQQPPAIPEFTAPASDGEARARLAAARGELNAVRMQFRAGELVARAAVHFASRDLRTRWAAMLAEDFSVGYAADLFPESNLALPFAQLAASVGGGRLSGFWNLGLTYGNLSSAARLFAEERWRRHGGYPKKDEVDAIMAADRVRVAETHRLRRERLEW
jgi:hypothetical protein